VVFDDFELRCKVISATGIILIASVLKMLRVLSTKLLTKWSATIPVVWFYYIQNCFRLLLLVQKWVLLFQKQWN